MFKKIKTLFKRKKILGFLYNNKRLNISNNMLIDELDITFDELMDMPIEESKKILVRWLKEKNLFRKYMKDVDKSKKKTPINNVYDFFTDVKKIEKEWEYIEFGFFYSFKII